jgi:hypothetical protein
MPDIKDRVEVASRKGGSRTGRVIAVSGQLLTIAWDTGGESSLIAGPGTLTVIKRRRQPAASTAAAAPARAIAKKSTAVRSTASKKAPAKKAPAKKAPAKKVAAKKAPAKKVAAKKVAARKAPAKRSSRS